MNNTLQRVYASTKWVFTACGSSSFLLMHCLIQVLYCVQIIEQKLSSFQILNFIMVIKVAKADFNYTLII